MKREYVIAFIIFFILSLGNFLNLCKTYYPLLFDNQILLTWQYSASIGQIPYRDIFYPYGLLSYYAGHTVFFSTLYILLAPFLFTSFYWIFKKLFQDRASAIICSTILFLFIIRFTGFELFERYGIFVAYSCFLAYVFYIRRNISKTLSLGYGFLSGVIFALFNDQGIYSCAFFFGFLVIDFCIKQSFKISIQSLLDLVKNGIFYIIGFLFGVIPLFLYLFYNHASTSFIHAVINLNELEQLAKLPFFHNFATPDNLFTLLILIISLYAVCYSFYALKKISLNVYIQIALVISLIIIEQKSIIRHIDNELSFVGVLLLFSLFINFISTFQISKIISQLILIGIGVFVIFIIPFHQTTQVKSSYSCSNRFTIQEPQFLAVQKALIAENYHGNIFSFPGDEALYILFHQTPPYYPSAFEASSYSAQQNLITYIQKNNVQRVIYNYKQTSIQDTVPDDIRSVVLNRYIFNNFAIEQKAGDYLILSKNVNNDFFKSNKMRIVPEFERYLLSADLANIPRSEGLYKSKYLFLNSKTLISGTIQTVNNYLANNTVNSKNLFLVVQSQNLLPKYQQIKVWIKTKDNLETSVRFYACTPEKLCIIHLSNLPLFYKDRYISQISSDLSVYRIILVAIPNASNFW